MIEIQVGRWYYSEYGYDTVLGKCVSYNPERKIIGLSFRWGTTIRSTHRIDCNRLISEGKDPRIIFKMLRFFKWISLKAKELDGGNVPTTLELLDLVYDLQKIHGESI